jgi:hypothetical protein
MTVDLATPLWIIALGQWVKILISLWRKQMSNEDLKPVTDQLDSIEGGIASLKLDNAKVVADLEKLLAGAPGEDTVTVSKSALAAIVARLQVAGTDVAAVDTADVAADAAANPPAPPPPTPAP